MIKKRYIYLMIAAGLILSGPAMAQDILRLEPFNVSQQYLVPQILADTTADGRIPEGRIYELDSGGVYLNNREMFVEADETLHIRSSGEERAIIYQYQSGTGDNPQNPPGNLFRTRGGDMILEGLAITGYFEPGDVGNDDYDELYTIPGNLLRTDGPGASIYLTNNVFSNVSGQILRTEAAVATIRMEDNILANLGALSTSNFGAGKGIDLRAVSVDSLILINNTFVNYQDRPIRHYNFGNPTAGTGAIGYGLFDHNTFVNGMGFHGVLSLGTVGSDIIITNNLFVDAFAAGEDETDETRTVEFANTGEEYSNGNPRMAWIFTNPNDVTNWVVANNYYAVSSDGQSFFDEHAEISVGDPLSLHIRERLGEAADNAFTMIDDPVMTDIPDLMLGLMDYYVNPLFANKTKDTPNETWDPATQDMDRRPITYYNADFDASYSTTSVAYTGASNGFPAGDLNWFPDQKQSWATSIEEPGAIPVKFAVLQNYPNPFNPSTTIRFQIATAADVQIEVFNMLGQKIATLVNNHHQPGNYSVNFDAGNLSSGIYIYTMKAGDIVQSRKMTLIK